ncbi:MAG: 50S ribosomal protein L28 [Planctomycetia bacterium]|nr:50S ribosomal protein L28 [Planctomycetia bacterium]
MARVCEVCGKGPRVGNSVTTRGKAKYLGGVGTKITGISRRQFKPNLQQVRATYQGRNRSMLVCTQCLRSGAVTKQVKTAPFRLPSDAVPKTKGADKAAKK